MLTIDDYNVYLLVIDYCTSKVLTIFNRSIKDIK